MNQTEIIKLFPEVFQRTIQPGSAFFSLIEVMEGFLTPLEYALDRLPENFLADRANRDFVMLLAYFVDLDRFLSRRTFGGGSTQNSDHFAGGIENLRALIKAVPELSRWRGTGYGLQLFLEKATGLSGYKISDQDRDARGNLRAFHITVTCPRGAMAYQDLVERIVEEEKPAFVTHQVVFTSFQPPIVDKQTAKPDSKKQPKPAK